MGKKGSWFSAIKRVFTHNTKEKPSYAPDKKSSKDNKKKGKSILGHGESKSFIPLFREPSSIEQILGEADQLLFTPLHDPKTTPPFLWNQTSVEIASPKYAHNIASSPAVTSPTVSSNRHNFPKKAPSPQPIFRSDPNDGFSKTDSSKVSQRRREIRYGRRLEPTLKYRHLSATMIQAAYRGYLARRNFRALRGLVRLQGMVRSENVKRQTMNAMKQMQLLVRVQTQIQSRRIQMLENHALYCTKEKDAESNPGKWPANQFRDAENSEDWDDSMLTKEEIEARLRQKLEAVMKRERAMAYAYSHQLWKSSNPKSAQDPLENQPNNGLPWWWSWLERELPPTNTPQNRASTKKVAFTPPKPIPDPNPSPLHNKTKHFQTTPIKTPSPAKASGFTKPYSKPRTVISYSSPYNDFLLKDDDSLTSCPPFSVPSYMAPTVSAKAKTRATSNPKERLQENNVGTPVNDSKRRFSFSFTHNIGSFKWNKGSSKNEPASRKVVGFEKRYAVGDLSIDSTVSMPAFGGRKPFNRFV
ncbi:IQ-domain 13 [Striga hermonthica]|uniref:IQ-domain 13 n=1 Tax=Striga hermonthica TaxID=68872 RepID=A0A9N7RJM7_STRHE|nr:IQ-domain 13 [Striga hermonthica]